MTENVLMQLIKVSLLDLEERGDIVICTSDTAALTKHIYEVISQLVPNEQLSTSELSGLRSLVLLAISDKRFFDWEMPILTGLTSEQFREVAIKLPKG